MTLLLAACEQAAYELESAEIKVDGLGEDLNRLGARLRDVLRQDFLKAGS